MPLEIDYYDLHVHKLMLHDRIRCEAFRRAINEVIKPGYTVLDIGAGTGILSIFSAQAGAATVYAVERTGIVELARRIVSVNGFTNRIKVYQNEMENVSLPERVDVIVSECLGGYGVDENLFPVVVLARDLWLKPEGKIIPERIASWIAPAYDVLLQKDVDFWNDKPYGVDLNAISKATVRQLHCCRNHLKQEHIVCAPQIMWEANIRSCSLDDVNHVFNARMTFVMQRNSRFNCLAAWFSAQLSEEIILSNEPSEQYTHWGRWVFPIGRSVSMERGEEIIVHFTLEPKGKGQTKAIWAIEAGDYYFHSEDTTTLTE